MNKKDKNDARRYLRELGFSDIEIDLYRGLLRFGPSNVSDLAEKTGVKRTTAYANVKGLLEKGLVSESRKGSERVLVGESPECLKTILKDRESELNHIKSNIGRCYSFLDEILNHSDSNTVEVRTFRGRVGIREVYSMALKAEKLYSFAHLERYYDVFPRSEALWINALEENKNREVWDILVDSPRARRVMCDNRYDRYYVKILPESKDQGYILFSDILVFDGMLVVVNLDPNNLYGTIFDSKSVYHTVMTLHNIVWSLLD